MLLHIKEITMNIKKIIAAVLAMAITLAAICIPVRENVSVEDEIYYEEEVVRTYTDGATQLSIIDGEFTINRRSREIEAPMAESGWTVLLYICGSDLESLYSSAAENIEEIAEAEYSEDVRVVIQMGGANEWHNNISNEAIQRFVKTEDGIECVEELDDANMGAPETLADFVSWGVENYPARKMGLILWDRGGGSVDGVCQDEKNDDSLTLAELDKALNSVYDVMTDRFEFIGFDACLMATLETANILVPYARYMYASEEIMSGSGWDYVDFLNFLANNTYTDGAELGKVLCGRMYDYYIGESFNDGMTFSVTALSMIDDLLTLFNETAQEIYDGGYLNEIAREIYKTDNFGGNNKSEGYTNMVDLLGLLNAASEYCYAAEDAIEALNNAVIEKTSGSVHKNAGGLSLYYPLSANSADELAEFAGICTSTYYLAFADLMAYGATGEDVYDYDNSWINEDIDNFRNINYSFSGKIEQEEEVNPLDEDSLIEVSEIYFDEDGTYTVQLYSTDCFSYGTCGLFTLTEDGEMYSLGEDDEVYTDLDGMMLQNCFDGSWPSIGGVPICIYVVSKNDEKVVYTCPIMLNDNITNLRFEYDFTEEKWNVLGAWNGIEPDSGMASREITEIKDGDVITPLYSYANASEDLFSFRKGEGFTVDGELTIEYKPLPAGEYNYAMNFYDVYGKQYCTDFVTFTCDENGEIYYDPGELENLQEDEENTDETDDESSEEKTDIDEADEE